MPKKVRLMNGLSRYARVPQFVSAYIPVLVKVPNFLNQRLVVYFELIKTFEGGTEHLVPEARAMRLESRT